MSILNREEFTQAVRNFVGENTDENAVSFVENMMDTYTDLESKQFNAEEFVPKSELDRTNQEWAKKDRDRFFEPENLDKDDEKKKKKTPEKKELTFENLFKKE